jgi:hypothetical protein
VVDTQHLDFRKTGRALADLCKQGSHRADADALPLLARVSDLLDAGARVHAGDVAFVAHSLGKMRLRGAAAQQAWERIAAWSEPLLHAFGAKDPFMAAPKMAHTRPLLEAIARQGAQRHSRA